MTYDWAPHKTEQQRDDENPWVKWTEPNMVFEATITSIREGRFDPVPELVTMDSQGRERYVTLNLAVLKRLVAEAGPQVGDGIWIKYLGEATSAKKGQNPAKLFEVKVTPKALMANSTAPAPVPAVASTAAASDNPPF